MVAREKLVLAVCFVTAMLEGADIIAMGLAAPTIVRTFGFGPSQVTMILTSAVVGMMLGALLGGRAGDAFGRKRMLLVTFAVVGVFSLATSFATDYATFVVLRFLCGLGLGGALPNLVAIVAESAPPASRSSSVSFVLAGQPVGGSLLGLFVASQAGGLDWRTIFVIGGVLPLVMLPIIALLLPESRAFLAASREKVSASGFGQALFAERRTPVTLLLWLGYGFTQVVVYLINNWLPTLMVAKGFTPRDAALISSIENMGAVAGCIVMGVLIDRGRIRTVMPATYAMMIVSIVLLAQAEAFGMVLVAGILTGFFVVGGQLVLYSVAPAYYPVSVRATGVGSAISAGRVGAIAGPVAAGELLAAGFTPQGVLLAATPCLGVAGIAIILLVFGFRRSDTSEAEAAKAEEVG